MKLLHIQHYLNSLGSYDTTVLVKKKKQKNPAN